MSEEIFIENVKQLVKDTYMNKVEEKCNLTHGLITKWFKKEAKPSLESVIKICEAYCVNIDDMLTKKIKLEVVFEEIGSDK